MKLQGKHRAVPPNKALQLTGRSIPRSSHAIVAAGN